MQISLAKLNLIKQYAAAAYPEECCGFLVGTVARFMNGDRENIVLEVVPCENILQGNRTEGFEISAGQYFQAEALARQYNYRVVGSYHSHTNAQAIPSATDCDALPPETSMVIVSVASQIVQEVRVYSRTLRSQLYQDVFEEQIQLRY
jgi:proteasome lid subunit RPN8/RPN11